MRLLVFMSTLALGVVNPPWIRLESQMRHPKKAGDLVAFIDGSKLMLLDLKNKSVIKIANTDTRGAHFWSPDRQRLFYRVLEKPTKDTIKSFVYAFDTSTHKTYKVTEENDIAGLITYDPREMKMHYITSKGLHSRRLVFPDERLARWQVAQKYDVGKWIASEKHMLWATDGGYALKPMPDDGSGLASFDISPDGQRVAWSTKDNRLYIGHEGKVEELGSGQDPTWHPHQAMLLYSAGHVVGDKVADFDLKIYDLSSRASKKLTATFDVHERWPMWDDDHVLYGCESCTDMFKIEVK